MLNSARVVAVSCLDCQTHSFRGDVCVVMTVLSALLALGCFWEGLGLLSTIQPAGPQGKAGLFIFDSFMLYTAPEV